MRSLPDFHCTTVISSQEPLSSRQTARQEEMGGDGDDQVSTMIQALATELTGLVSKSLNSRIGLRWVGSTC